MSIPKCARYSVWRNKDDSIVIIDGTPEECCRAMGISRSTLYPTVSKCKAGLNCKWHIEVIYEGINREQPPYLPEFEQERNRQKRREASAIYRRNNRERIRKNQRRWISEHPDYRERQNRARRLSD